jgi:ATP-binding cassette subfamily B protein
METPEPDVPVGRLFDPALLKRAAHYVRPYAGAMVLALLLVVPMTLMANAMPILLRDATDRFLTAGRGAPAAERIRGLADIVVKFLALGAGAFFFRFFQGYLMTWIGQRILFDLRADIFAKIMRLPLRYFDRHPVGRLLTRISSDVDAIQRLLTDGLVGLSTDLISLVAVLGFMFYVSPRLATIMLALLPPLLLILVVLNSRVRAAHRQVRQKQSALNSYLQEMITGMLTIQLFNRERTANLRFDHHNAALRAAFLRSVKWFSYTFPATEIMNVLTVSLVVGFGAFRLIQGHQDITMGVLIAFLAYIRDFFRPLDDLSEKSNVLQSAMASSERVFSLLDTPEEIVDPAAPAILHDFRGDVEFDRVWFAYTPGPPERDEEWVLRDVSFRIAPGESVALVGATGAGKSSVISLIARFYDIQQGAVRVDGQDVRAYRQEDLRRRIGIVLQDPFLFSGTLADNISLHNPRVTRERVVEAARYVNAHRFIEQMPGGYDAPVMERGAGLSTGQKQLLALARAIAQDPDILLILDEATASVDTETEVLIQDALEKLMKGRTSIIIAHRLSTIRHANRIFVMRHGRIVEQGSHAELARLGGYYRKLYDLLSLGQGATAASRKESS